MKLSGISLKEERTEQQKFWDLVAKDIASNFEFDYRKDERWTKAISESNGDKEQATDRGMCRFVSLQTFNQHSKFLGQTLGRSVSLPIWNYLAPFLSRIVLSVRSKILKSSQSDICLM